MLAAQKAHEKTEKKLRTQKTLWQILAIGLGAWGALKQIKAHTDIDYAGMGLIFVSGVYLDNEKMQIGEKVLNMQDFLDDIQNTEVDKKIHSCHSIMYVT